MKQGAVAADGQQQFRRVGEMRLGNAVNVGRQAVSQCRVDQYLSPTGVQMAGDIRHQSGDAFVVGTAHQGDGLEHASNLQ